jgi:putative addiction module component (TIGR02574 family)
MSNVLEKLELDALRLTRQERAFLADRLLSSLDGDAGATDVDRAWITEAEHRYQEYKDGKRQGIAAREVLADASRIVK